MKISIKHTIGGILIGIVLLVAAFLSLPDGKLHLVFCDVGQGDALYVRTAGGEDLLIDGGPNDKVLACLGRHMPFYDRTIELIFLSHPQADHLNGLISVLERYSVDYFVSSGIGNTTEGYKKLAKLLAEKKVVKKSEHSGGKITLGGLKMETLWPDKLDLNTGSSSYSDPGSVLGSFARDLNEFSLILKLSYGQFDALLTGDAGKEVLREVGRLRLGFGESVEILKVPHHGSKTGLTADFLEAVKPRMAVISVGKNSYGHPAEEILKILKDYGTKILRTDWDGEIEIVSDGETWYTKTK